MTIPAMELGDEAPTALYRLYDDQGKLLYVGITGDLKARFAAHAATKSWWPEVARKTVEWHATRESAAKAELKAIQSEEPEHNIQGRILAGVDFDLSDLRKKVSGTEILDLVMLEMPPSALRLALLELLGVPTRAALEMLGVGRTHSYRVIKGRKTPPPRKTVQSPTA